MTEVYKYGAEKELSFIPRSYFGDFAVFHV